jgi:hypothetical protein
MSIKPIDLQTNMAQMHEVGRGEQARTGAVAEKQHVLDEEAAKQSELAKERLEESKKADKTEVRDALSDDKEKDGRKGKQQKGTEKTKGSETEGKLSRSHDDRMGRIIDVLK